MFKLLRFCLSWRSFLRGRDLLLWICTNNFLDLNFIVLQDSMLGKLLLMSRLGAWNMLKLLDTRRVIDSRCPTLFKTLCLYHFLFVNFNMQLLYTCFHLLLLIDQVLLECFLSIGKSMPRAFGSLTDWSFWIKISVS